MATFEKSIFIKRPPQEIWDFFSNPANSSQWSTTESAEWTSEGPPDVGSIQHSVGKFLGRKVESTSEITVWDPPNEHGYKSTSGPFPWEFTTRLEPKENGTQLNGRGTAEIGGFFKIAEGLAVKQAAKQIDANFEALKLVLETGQA